MGDGFKRDIYFRLKELLNGEKPIFLLGPRKTGKTFALKQLAHDLPNCEMYDFKEVYSKDMSMDIFTKACEDVVSGVDKVYLLDEITYAFYPEQEIAKVAGAFTDAEVNGVKVNTKIIFTGSQSRALESWGRLAFCGSAEFIKLDFLSYPEWLRYKGITEVSNDSYISFIGGVKEFYKNTGTIEEYLQGCIEETIQSSMQSRSLVRGLSCDGLTVELMKSVMYLALLSLHDHITGAYLVKQNRLGDRLMYMRRQDDTLKLTDEYELADRLSRAYIHSYDVALSVNISQLRLALAFLVRCDLITVTPISAQTDKMINVLAELESIDSIYKTTTDLLESVTITVRHPTFMVEIIKDILGPDIDLHKHMPLVGSVLECHARGLLPNFGAIEYRDTEDREIDYINLCERVAIEFTVSNKKVSTQTHFNIIDDASYIKVLLSRDKSDVVGDVIRIPYYHFIAEMSGDGDSKELLSELISKWRSVSSNPLDLKALGMNILNE